MPLLPVAMAHGAEDVAAWPPAPLVMVLAACWPSLPPGRLLVQQVLPFMVMRSSDHQWRRLGFRGGDQERDWARGGGVGGKKP
jgi:hypothetical protein